MNVRQALTTRFALAALLTLATGFTGPVAPARAAETRPPEGAVRGWLVASRLAGGVRELEAHYGEWADVALAAAHFHENGDTPVLPEELRAWPFQAPPPPAFLTVTNELRSERNRYPRDEGLVGRLLDDAGEAPLSALASLLAGHDWAGLELDFYPVPEGRWQDYLDFCARLAAHLAGSGHRLRVVLTIGERLPDGKYPAAVEYVARALPPAPGAAGPGPLLLPGRIRRLADECARLPKMPVLMLPLGGGHWIKRPHSADAPQERKFFYAAVTEAEAAALTGRQKVSPERDRASGYLVCGYVESEESATGRLRPHYLWWADALTARGWLAAARAAGFREFGFWHLGGSRPGTLAELVEDARLTSSIAAGE